MRSLHGIGYSSDLERSADHRVGFANLPVELFKTNKSRWVLDVNKVEFVKVDDVAFDVIGCLRRENLSIDELVLRLPQHSHQLVQEALAAVVSAQQQGYFVPASFHRSLRFRPDQYQSVLQDRMAGLTISITTRCNLACSYCIFGGGYSRNPVGPERTMTWPVLEKALDFLLAHSRLSRRIRVLFFGGEPLIAFPLIRRAVAYLHSALRDDPRELQLAICTNGTIINDAILEFLVENNVTVQVSLDGDSETHDEDRRFKKSGKGSYETVLKNLAFIERRDHDYFRAFLRIKGVVQSAEDQASTAVFQKYPITELPPEHVSFIILEPHYDVSQDTHYFRQLDWLGETLRKVKGASTLGELLERLSPNQREFFWQSYGWFFASQAIQRLGRRGQQDLPFSKGCMIGAAEGNVGPDGNIAICDKAQNGSAFVIGNVVRGEWNFEAIDRLSSWLHSFDDCSSCFAQRFCDLCFEKLQGEEESLESSREDFCRFTRRSMRVIFGNMLEVMDNNPVLWDEVVSYIDRRVVAERIDREKRLRAWA